MAARRAWWMRNSATNAQARPSDQILASQPWRAWPYHASATGLGFDNLDKYLTKDLGENCDVLKFVFEPDTNSGNASWKNIGRYQNYRELEGALKNPDSSADCALMYLISRRSPQVFQLLGYHLNLTPRFLTSLEQMLSTGVPVERYIHFSIQIMDCYPDGKRPSAAEYCAENMRFRKDMITNHDHTWRVSNIAFIATKISDTKLAGVVLLDDADEALHEALEKLMLKKEDNLPGVNRNYVGVGEVVTELIYLIAFNWEILLEEAGAHMQILNVKCIMNQLTSVEQLTYTKELHQLTSFSVHVRRRIFTSVNLVEQIMGHPFFSSAGAESTVTPYMQKQLRILREHLARLAEIEKEANVLISLIFNISTLQDTRAAIDEGKAANRIAASVRRISIIATFYLPLTLAAGIFGMNVTQITADPDQGQIYWFVVLAVGLTALTLLTWAYTSRVKSRQSLQLQRLWV